MVRKEEEIRDQAIWRAVEEVMLAVRTAPKTRGIDNLSILAVDGDNKEQLAAKMDEIYEKSGGKRDHFARDAKGVMASSAVLLVGTKAPAYGVDCGRCGFPTCADKSKSGPTVPCVFPIVDLGIGIGVAASRLSDKHVDNRVMFSIGMAAMELGWFGPDVAFALGFPLSVSGKNPHFDR